MDTCEAGKDSEPRGAASQADDATVDGKMTFLQHQLRQEMEMHLREGRTSVEQNQERVSRILHLREELRREEARMKEANPKPEQSGATTRTLEESSQAEYSNMLQRRRKMKEDHGKVIEEELLKMEQDLGEERMEGPEAERKFAARERQLLLLQVEALRREAELAERELEMQHVRHQQEIHNLREESLQVGS
ncbi:trichohyalin-like [Denticeps clupeoides]|uniref:trichohyalin-like n=1 Tax=Denticeps clupeoides TaxID=299321 RepID=UPI0010A47A53|nr:trichohyalin-like [Denticeps clupeoides]